MADWLETLEKEGVCLDRDAEAALYRYYEMLLDWNGRMDLTSVNEQDMGQRHFVDSLLPLREKDLFEGSLSVIDVGTGAGFPGLALAIARRDFRVTLLEAQEKRCRFLRAVCETLGLTNATVIQDRAETLGRAEEHRERYDLAVARAVAPLNVLCEYLLPFARVGGFALCWKGPAVAEETKDGQYAAGLLGGGEIQLRNMDSRDMRHILAVIPKIEKTVPQYPRRNGIPIKRPLKNGKI